MSAPGRLAGRHIVICNWRDSAHPQAGGAELYCEEVARHLHARGATVTLLTSRPPGAAARTTVDFGTVVRLGGTFATYARGLAWLAAHRAGIHGVIDSENGIPYFSRLAVTRRTPVVLLIHHVHQEQFALYLPPALARAGRLLEKWGARLVYGKGPVCVVSPSARAEVRRQLAFRGPSFIAPNGLTVSEAYRDVGRHPDPRIVCVGRLVPHKRFELLVDAIPRLLGDWPALEVHIVGDGESREGLEKLVAERGLGSTVVFHGRIPMEERDRLTASAWLTVNSTAGEGWGLSVVEAAAQGVPAVAFSVPGMQDSVRHGSTGWLVEDGSELSHAIDTALRDVADPAEAARWAQRCKDWASAFTWDATTERLVAVLASEQSRLVDRLDERRRGTEVATVVEVPRRFATPEVVARLRRTDQVRARAGTVELLLAGADEHDARRAMDRVGLAAAVPDARIRIARYYDLLGWVARDRFDPASGALPGGGDGESRVVVAPGAFARRGTADERGRRGASRDR